MCSASNGGGKHQASNLFMCKSYATCVELSALMCTCVSVLSCMCVCVCGGGGVRERERERERGFETFTGLSSYYIISYFFFLSVISRYIYATEERVNRKVGGTCSEF